MWRTRRRGSKALGADVAADAHQDSKAVAPPPPPPPAVAPAPPPAVAPDVRELAARRDIPGLVEALGYKANSPDREHFSVRNEAAFALGEIGDPLTIVPLISAFDDLYSRVSAAYALAAIGTPAFKPLLRTVQDASVTHGRGPRERSRARDRASTALSALGRMKDPRAVEPLILTLKSQGPSDNFSLDTRYVVEALGDLGDPRAVDALVDVLKSDDLRFEAIVALEKLGDPSAVGPLEALQDDPSGLVRDRAARALESLDSSRLEARRKELADRGLAGLVAILGGERISDEGIEAMKLLTDAGERAVPLLVDSLGSHDWTVRWRSAVILGRIGDRAAAQPLIDALSDSNVEVRFYAAEALGRLGDPSAVGPLIAALHDSGNYVQQAAAEALGNLGDSRAAEPLTAAAQQAREGYVREAAAKALEKIGS